MWDRPRLIQIDPNRTLEYPFRRCLKQPIGNESPVPEPRSRCAHIWVPAVDIVDDRLEPRRARMCGAPAFCSAESRSAAAVVCFASGQQNGDKTPFSLCECKDLRVAPTSRAANHQEDAPFSRPTSITGSSPCLSCPVLPYRWCPRVATVTSRAGARTHDEVDVKRAVCGKSELDPLCRNLHSEIRPPDRIDYGGGPVRADFDLHFTGR